MSSAGKKKKLRFGISFAVAIPLFIVIYYLLLPRFLHDDYVAFVIFMICLFIGYLPSESVVKSVFGAGTGTGEILSAPKVFKYVFTD